jgi:hypothetical protein
VRLASPKYHGLVLRLAAILLLFFLVIPSVAAQSNAADTDYQVKGFTAYIDSRGSVSSLGQFYVIDPNIGYDFNRHVGIDLGIPAYFDRPTQFLPGESHGWKENLGDPYLDLNLTFLNRVLDYQTVFTASAPVTGTGAFSTGRVGLDWFNHFDRPIYRVTPFVNAGLANGILNTRLLDQPFRLIQNFKTLGLLGDVEGGLSVRIWRGLGVGGSYYALLPVGNQKVYGNGAQPALLVGNESLSQVTHDRGYEAWVKITPVRFLYLTGGYAHSIKFNQDAATFGIGIDVVGLFKRPKDVPVNSIRW